MITKTRLVPFKALPPGYTIKRYLEDRGWTQDDLADIVDISSKQVSQIVSGKARITLETALLLAQAFDTSPEFWLNLENNYRLDSGGSDQKPGDAQRKSQIRKYVPATEIERKGWFTLERSADGYENLYKSIWNQNELDMSVYEDKAEPYCARQKKTNQEFSKYYSRTWQQIARRKSAFVRVPYFRLDSLQSVIADLTAYTTRMDGVANFIRDINAAGVKFLVLSHLSKTYLDGACFLDEGNPVVVYTGRYDRVDNFWFTVAHELAHIVLHLNEMPPAGFLDDLHEGEAKDVREQQADREAEKYLRVAEILESSRPFVSYFSESKLEELSRVLSIEKSVILGVLQHKGMVEYRKLSKFKRKVLPLIPKEVNFG